MSSSSKLFHSEALKAVSSRVRASVSNGYQIHTPSGVSSQEVLAPVLENYQPPTATADMESIFMSVRQKEFLPASFLGPPPSSRREGGVAQAETCARSVTPDCAARSAGDH